MDQYAGLDVSALDVVWKETSIPVRRSREPIWRGKCLFDLVAEMVPNDKEAHAGCRIGGVRDRAARNFVSSQTHRRWRHASARMRRRHPVRRQTRPVPTAPIGCFGPRLL